MIRLFFGCIGVYLAAAGWVFGASSSFEFTVAAGPQERNNVPVRVQMSRGQIGQERIASVTLAGTDGKQIPAQWTGPGLGGHGFGVRKTSLACSAWTDRFVDWLQSQGMLRTNVQAK